VDFNQRFKLMISMVTRGCLQKKVKKEHANNDKKAAVKKEKVKAKSEDTKREILPDHRAIL
jgi:hypothetical protein